MTEDSTQTLNAGIFSPAHRGERNGLQEQTVLLDNISKQLDVYFALRHLKTEE